MKQFYSDHLAFRNLDLRDTKNLFELFRDWAAAGQLSTQPTPRSVEQIVAQAINNHERKTGYAWGKDEVFAVTEKNGTTPMPLVGYIKLEPAGLPEAELGYWIALPYRGRGYMPEAVVRVLEYCFDNNPVLQNVSALTDPVNIASERVLIKTGFHLSGDIPTPPSSHLKSAHAKLWHLSRTAFGR